MFDLSKRVAVVVGSSSGLGMQMSKALARQGAKVALLARREDRLKQLADELEKDGHEALAVRCDVTSTEDIKNAATTVMEKFGRVDILVNSAGSSKSAPTETCTDESWEKIINLNLTAVFKCAREFGSIMINQKYGRIINIASMYGTVGNAIIPNLSYHASKGAVVNLTRELAAQWAKYNITVNAIGPGMFPSELTSSVINEPAFLNILKTYCPMGRPGRDGELDGAVVFLASDEASYTTGITLCVDGGWTAI